MSYYMNVARGNGREGDRMQSKTTVTDKEIRECFGHNGVECRVRIKRNGVVLRYGSPDLTDRSKDFWQWLGRREEIERDMTDTSGAS